MTIAERLARGSFWNPPRGKTMKTYRAWTCTDGTVDVVEHCDSCGSASIIQCNLPAEIAEKEIAERNAWEANSFNARLISAAPDLLAALQAMCDAPLVIDAPIGSVSDKARERSHVAYTLARAAIAKATGE